MYTNLKEYIIIKFKLNKHADLTTQETKETMDKKTQTQNVSKIESIKSSVNTMIECVNYLEKIKSYDYMGSINDNDLQIVLSQMKEIEEKLENINKTKAEKKVFKAIGKNRTIWVTKPVNSDPHKEKKETNKAASNNRQTKNIINKDEIEKLFKKSHSSESIKPEKNIKTRLLAAKYNLTNFF